MEKKQITQRELSEQTGIAATTLSRMSNNYFYRVDIETLAKLANYFEIKSGSELFECVITQDE